MSNQKWFLDLEILVGLFAWKIASQKCTKVTIVDLSKVSFSASAGDLAIFILISDWYSSFYVYVHLTQMIWVIDHLEFVTVISSILTCSRTKENVKIEVALIYPSRLKDQILTKYVILTIKHFWPEMTPDVKYNNIFDSFLCRDNPRLKFGWTIFWSSFDTSWRWSWQRA